MLLRCLRFDTEVIYKPGIKIPVADALSRVCLKPAVPPQKHEISFVSGIKSPIDLSVSKTKVPRIQNSIFSSTQFTMAGLTNVNNANTNCGTTGTSDAT